MRLNKVDLNLFVVFDVIYTERNLTRAGEVLCLTQPTVSNALSRLRKTFNDELFVRSPKGMAPTPVRKILSAGSGMRCSCWMLRYWRGTCLIPPSATGYSGSV